MGSAPARAADLEKLYPNLAGKTRRSITAEARAAEQVGEKIRSSFEHRLKKKEKKSPRIIGICSQAALEKRRSLARTMRLSVEAGVARVAA